MCVHPLSPTQRPKTSHRPAVFQEEKLGASEQWLGESENAAPQLGCSGMFWTLKVVLTQLMCEGRNVFVARTRC